MEKQERWKKLEDFQKPNVDTFNALISACGKAGKVEKALWVLDEMNAVWVKPTVVTCSILILHVLVE